MKNFQRIAILGLHLLLLLFITTNVHCQELYGNQLSGNLGKPVIDYGQIIYAAVFLILMVFGALFLVKKSNFNHSNSAGFIDIVYNHAITSKDKLLIVKIGEEYLLLGVSAAGINKLHELDKETIQKMMSEKNIKTNDFSNILVNLISKHRNA